MKTTELIQSLCSLMSINGYEYTDSEKLEEIVLPYFDECVKDNVGNHIFVKKCGRENAKKIFIDTHFDEIGLMVKDITDDGFLRVCSIGGVDARLLPGAELVVYGNGKNIKAVAFDKPDCIRKKDEHGKLTAVTDIMLDTGLDKMEVSKYVNIGTPVGFAPVYGELENGYFFGKSLDDKLCAVSVIRAIEMIDKEKLAFDVYFSMSCREEVGHKAVSAGAFKVEPDAAIVIDVTFGCSPDGRKGSEMKMGGGAVISHAAILNKKLTRALIDIAKEKELPYQICVEGVGTGTHADDVAFVGRGIPTALVSVPIWFMHTPVETTCVDDVENTAKLICAALEKEDLI